MRKLILAACGAAVLALGAMPAAAADSTCIRHDEILNWKYINEKSVVIESNSHKKILLTLIGTCANLNFSEGLEIRSPDAFAISCIEKGDTVITHQTGFRGTCAITAITPYTAPQKPPAGY